MENTKTAMLIGSALATLILLWAPLAAAMPRSNTLTVVPTTKGPLLCGPAIVIQNMGGTTWAARPARAVPVMPTAASWYVHGGGARLEPLGPQFMGPVSQVPANPPRPNEVICRPLSAATMAWRDWR
jgi:hypothetical protein